MPVERITIFGAGKVTRKDFKHDMHLSVQRNRLYPTLYQLIKIGSPSKFSVAADFFSRSYDLKICPAFILATLKSVQSAQPLIDAEDLKISKFNFDRLKTLSNRVYRTRKDREEQSRWQVHNEIKGRLFNAEMAPMDRIKVLENEGIITLEANPNAKKPPEPHPTLFDVGEPKEKKTPEPPKRDPVSLGDVLKQGSFFSIEGFGKPVNKKGDKKD